MIRDLNGSLWSRQFLNVADERTCFISYACTFKSTKLFILVRNALLTKKLPMFLSRLTVAKRFCQYRDHFEVIKSFFRMMDFTAVVERVKCESE